MFAARTLAVVALLSPFAARAASIAVTTTTDELADPGPGSGCSLREAIRAAELDTAYGGCPAGSGADDISLPGPAPYTLTLVGSGEEAGNTGDLDITSVITIIGDGPTIDGNSTDRIFDVKNGGALTLVDVTLHHGQVTGAGVAGGCIKAVGALHLDQVTFDTCTAQGIAGANAGGGAVYSDGTFDAVDSYFTGNQANGGGNAAGAGGYGLGGAIYSSFGFTLTHVDFFNNAVHGGTSTGGTGIGGGGIGGAIDVLADSTIDGCQLSTNVAWGGDGSVASGIGEGGAIANLTGNLRLIDSSIDHNQVYGGAHAVGTGGALFANGPVSIDNGFFQSNIAIGGSAPTGNGGFAGGGALHTEAPLTIVDSYFDSNWSVGSSAPSGNGGGANGGAIDTIADASITSTGFSGNLAVGGDGVNYAGDANGGALYGWLADLTLEDCDFASNYAEGGNAIAAAWAWGGAIGQYGPDDNSFVLLHSRLHDNLAVGGNGSTTGQARGGGISLIGDDSGAIGLVATISGCDLESNESDAGTGGSGWGGGVFVDHVHLTVEGSTLARNRAVATYAGGGGIDTYYTDGEFVRTTFSANFAGGVNGIGGGLLIGPYVSAPMRLQQSTVAGNRAIAEGGGVFIDVALDARNLILANNTSNGAADQGGGGDLRSFGYMLIGDSAGSSILTDGAPGLTDEGLLLDVRPNLEPLRDNGGWAPTQAITSDSLAWNAGSCVDIVGATVGADQRGGVRPAFGACDLGAYETQGDQALVIVTDDPPSCDHGGQQFDVGIDIDGDGALIIDEVQSSTFVCNGADGHQALVEVTPASDCDGQHVVFGIDSDDDGDLGVDEAASEVDVCNGSGGVAHDALSLVTPDATVCSGGGVRIDVGTDDDDDHVLDPGEVDSTSYVCTPATLTLAAPEPAGANCAVGGSRLDSGRDDDGDGTLDAEEIESTSYLCNASCSVDSHGNQVTITCPDGSTATFDKPDPVPAGGCAAARGEPGMLLGLVCLLLMARRRGRS